MIRSTSYLTFEALIDAGGLKIQYKSPHTSDKDGLFKLGRSVWGCVHSDYVGICTWVIPHASLSDARRDRGVADGGCSFGGAPKVHFVVP
jgi:hypothetical protein